MKEKIQTSKLPTEMSEAELAHYVVRFRPLLTAARDLAPGPGLDPDTDQGRRRHRGVPAGSLPPVSRPVACYQLHRQGP